ncbi:MAG: adenylate/guanylate cyclase domain-containing protein [Geminicoccaceae bacterium]
MTDPAALAGWLTQAGLAGMSEAQLLDGFCQRLVAGGLPLSRALAMVDTLHPIYEGRAFRWELQQAGITAETEYGRTGGTDQVSEQWRRSPFYHLYETGGSRLRCSLVGTDLTDFPVLQELRDGGHTDYLALIHRFDADDVVGGMECVYSSWTSDAPGGFDEPQVTLLEQLVPVLALALKCRSLARIAATLVETYLGRDAGRRVLGGRIARGVAERISAVLWFSDLRGYTRISDRAPPDSIIPLLNDYADAIISSVHEAGGDVLKLIGDGILAIFHADEAATACGCALTAEALARERVAALNERRAATGLDVTEAYLGLHIGEVFYGNIGSEDRLDFTVVGPAVNEVSRIAAMCRAVDRDVLLSSAFAAAATEADRARLVSVGRYALRGVGKPQELYTLDLHASA